MKISTKLLKKLPKVELHCHLDGSLRIATILDLAKKNNIGLPTKDAEELKKLLCFGKNRGSLEGYLAKFEITLSVLQTPESLVRVAFELIEDVAKENIRYIEVRYSPILHTKSGMSPGESIEAVLKGLKNGEKEFGVQSGIIVCGIRNISPEISLNWQISLYNINIKVLWDLILPERKKTILPSTTWKHFT